MSETIYSDLCARAIKQIGSHDTELEVQLFKTGNLYKPDLVLPNLTAIRNLRNYLTVIIDENKEYWRNE